MLYISLFINAYHWSSYQTLTCCCIFLLSLLYHLLLTCVCDALLPV